MLTLDRLAGAGVVIPELCDLLTTSASGKGFLKLRDAILLAIQAVCFLADGRQVASLYGGQLISEAQLSMLRESLSKAILMVGDYASLCLLNGFFHPFSAQLAYTCEITDHAEGSWGE